MWLSVQQVLANPNRVPEIPKAASDTATMDLEPLSLHLITKLGHPKEEQTKLETHLWKLQAQVIPPCRPTLALGLRAQKSP